MRIIQISDTHISRQHGDFRQNIAAVAAKLEPLAADLLIDTGDISMNGAVGAADLEDAVAWHRALERPMLMLPGNHDVGDLPTMRADQVLDDEKLDRYRAIAGEDRWIHDVPGWRLVGMNAMLCATGHSEELRQYEWLEAALETTDRVALFLHKPMYVEDPDEPARGYWTIPPEPRRRMLDIMARADIRLVASGHLHVARTARFGDADHVWCPSSAFVCGPIQADVPGERRIGFLIHDLGDAGVESRFVFPEHASQLTIDPVLDRIYPTPADTALSPEVA